MTTISTLQNDLLTTPLDVRLMNEILQNETVNSNILVDDNRILRDIYFASSEVRATLYRVYDGDSMLETIPVAIPPIIPKYNEQSGVTENTGDGVLYGIVPSEDAKTEQWTIIFTSTTAYDVVGSRSGGQGSGDTSSDFTSTNTWITIPSDVWSGTPATGDKFYVAVWAHYPMVVYLTTLIAASLIHNSIFNFVAPNETPITDKFRTEANRILGWLNKGYDENGTPFRLPSFSADDLSEIPIPWYIDRLGSDISNYSSTEQPNIITGDIALRDVPYWYY